MQKGSSLNWAWRAFVVLAFAGLFMVGGTSAPVPSVRLFISLLSIVVLAASIWHLRLGVPTRLATWGLVLIGLMWALFALQLIPLPQALSFGLPGREAFRTAAGLAGISGMTPLSLSTPLTLEALSATLPGVAMFAAALTVEGKNRQLFALVIVVMAVLAALLGVAQRFIGQGMLQIYGAADQTTGWFANRNFFAAQLYTSIPLLGALTLSAVRQQKLPGWLATILSLAYLTIILGGLAASASRTAIILSMAAIIATALLPWGSINSIRTRASRRTLLYVAIIFVFVFSQFGLTGLLRLEHTDPLGEYRTTIAGVSWQAFLAFFPAGTGFGTFVPVYQMFETPAVLRPEYINHAHNDWLEIALEGGLPALILLLFFGGWLVAACVRIWSRRSEVGGDLVMAAASISAILLLMHSVVDYPLRTPALMALFGLCLGFTASAFVIRHVSHRAERPAAEPQIKPSVARRPFTPFKPTVPPAPTATSAEPGEKP